MNQCAHDPLLSTACGFGELYVAVRGFGGAGAQCHRSLVIPARHCANLSAAVYTVLYDRNAKRVRDGLELPHDTARDFEEPDHLAGAVGVTRGGLAR